MRWEDERKMENEENLMKMRERYREKKSDRKIEK